MNELIITAGSRFEVALIPEAFELKAKALKTSSGVKTIRDDIFNQVAYDSLKALKSVIKHVESSRTEAKKPALEFGRKIDGLSKEFSIQLVEEAERIEKLISEYETEKRRVAAEIEAKRQTELRRLEEEKRRVEEEERLKREEAERALLHAKNEKQRQEAEERLKQQREEEQRRKDQEAAAAKAALLVAKPQFKAEGSVVKEVWTFTVTDIHALYRAHPELVRLEASASAINAKLSAGMRECPGLEIRKELKVGVR